ncbi:MAG: hypothetical protein JJU06_11310 [Ectothiorhodospiraceae bacterium]|nr:hypothetical protein [Ectothiorhodospiraceae bacterium]
MRRVLFAMAGFAGLAFSLQAGADVRAVYSTPEGEFTVEYRDADHMRFGMGDGAFLVITGGEGYVLSRSDDGWIAVSAEQIRAMTAGSDAATDQYRLTATGQKETVAGVEGERYLVEVGDDWADDWREDGEVVLSSDARVRPLGGAFKRLAEVFGDVEGRASMADAQGVDLDRMAPIASEDMRLTSISTSPLPDRNFQLPPGVSHREMPAMGRRSGGDSAAEQREPGWLGRQMEYARDEATEETERETRREIRDGVREGVRGLFNR